MKQLSKLAAALVVAGGALGAGQAMASNCVAAIFKPCTYGGLDNTGYVYTGALDATINEKTNFNHFFGSGTGTFSDVWVFDLSPIGGTFSVNASFQPLPGGISDFTVTLHTLVSGTGCTTATVVNTSCSAAMTLAGAVPGVNVVGSTFILPYPLAAGQYAFVVSGFVNAGSLETDYSGQVSTARILPEPASLALVGVALLGAAVGARRARKA